MDNIFSLIGSLQRSISFPTSPPHNGSLIRQSVSYDFIPSYHLLSIGKKELFHLTNKPCLQLLNTLQVFCLHTTTAIRTLAPIDFLYLITSQVYILRWEQLENLLIHILAELKSSIFSRTNRRRESLTPTYHSFTSQIRILRNSSKEMSRHIHFRNNLNTTLCSISHYLTNIFLCIESTIQSISFGSNLQFIFG